VFHLFLASDIDTVLKSQFSACAKCDRIFLLALRQGSLMLPALSRIRAQNKLVYPSRGTYSCTWYKLDVISSSIRGASGVYPAEQNSITRITFK
jgi:hypothetical protein